VKFGLITEQDQNSSELIRSEDFEESKLIKVIEQFGRIQESRRGRILNEESY